jgi:MoaA/NifB/PqqE/SkfB family radical SAM enzyme
MDQQSVYCTAPWNGLTVREDGRVLTCCVGRTTLGNLNVDTIESIEYSSALKKIQAQMLGGNPDLENCANCIKQEKIDGYSSSRNHYNKFYPDFDPTQLKLKYLDLRWNNTCNLACMYCGPHFSSTWTDKLKIHNLKPVKPYQDELLSWILERASHIKEIALVGGEPLLMKQNYELLKVLPLDCQISILTNLSYDLKNLPCLPDLLKRPADKVIWTISGENTNQQFEYVRQGADWNQFEDNIKFLGQHWANSLTLGMVYSTFNAFNLLEIVKTYKELGLQKFNLLPIDRHYPINVSFMPAPIRLLAKQVLDQVLEYHYDSLHPEDRDLYPIIGLDQVSKHLEQGGGHVTALADFQKQINWYDQWSSVPFNDLWPNVVNLTNQHLI